jgi:HD-GYP domain-containing protein (c-di-GMP phosphodiesterase class II)
MSLPDWEAIVSDPESLFSLARDHWTEQGVVIRVTNADGQAMGPTAEADVAASGPAARSAVIFQGQSIAHVGVQSAGAVGPDEKLAAYLADVLARELRYRHQISDLSKALVESFKELGVGSRLQEMLAVRLPLRQILELGVRQAAEWIGAGLASVRLTPEIGSAGGIDGAICWPAGAADTDAALNELADVVLMTHEPLLHHWATEDGSDGSDGSDSADGADGANEAPAGRWRARLGVPIVYQGRACGVLLLARESGERPFTTIDQRFLATVANQMAIAIENSRLLGQVRDAFFSMVMAMADAIEKRDDYTGGHTQRVAGFALLMADGIGLSPRLRGIIHVGAMLHDVGKIGVDDAILRKQGRLTVEEFGQMKRHPLIGAEILANIPPLREVVSIVRHHHERHDGKGYPDGLQGNEIPLLARIVMIADTFDAMTSDRPYRKGMPLARARDEIRRCAGTQFDPNLAALFLDIEVGKLLEIMEEEAWSIERSREVLSHIDLSGVFGEGGVLGIPTLPSEPATQATSEPCLQT